MALPQESLGRLRGGPPWPPVIKKQHIFAKRAATVLRLLLVEEFAMLLTKEQVRTYEQEGYLFLPNCYTSGEIDVLKAELLKVFA